MDLDWTRASRHAFSVRDYECDLQGVVNNSVYQNYLEHARHEHLLARDVDFAALSRDGVQLVLVRAELDYRRSLVPKDRFEVWTQAKPEGRVRVVFDQRITKNDGTVVLEARMVATSVMQGRPRFPPGLMEQICS